MTLAGGCALFGRQTRIGIREFGLLSRQPGHLLGLLPLPKPGRPDQQGGDDGRGAHLFDNSELALELVPTLHRSAAVQDREVGVHFLGGGVARLGIGRAGAQQHGVQLHQGDGFAVRADLREWLGEFVAVFPHRGFVEHLAQRVEVGLRRGGAFGRDEPFRADERVRACGLGHQTDVGQLGHAAHEDDVGGLDVAVNEALAVEMAQGETERHAELEALLER